MGWRHRNLFLCLALSLLFSLTVSVPTAYISSFTIPDWLAGQPVQLRSTHTRTAAIQRERASSAFTCRSCLQPPWGWILLSSLITVAQAEINLQHSITLGFVYEMVSQEQIHWGLFKGFLVWTMDLLIIEREGCCE